METVLVTVLLVEGKHNTEQSFAPALAKRYTLLTAHTGKIALELATQHSIDVIVLDAASLRTSGDRLSATFRNNLGDIPIIHIKDALAAHEHESPADIVLFLPFTYRKLCNRIERYTAVDQGKILRVAGLELNLQNLISTTPIGERKLTPKEAKLLEILMRHPGKVVERKQLIKEVWQTDYMGDTRTLDVHIRWLRQAVEENPSKPQLIKTVRGKGYMLAAR